MSVSLIRRDKSPYWYAFFRTPDPDKPGRLKQHLKSTKETNKAEAKRKALEIEGASLLAAGAGDEKSKAIYTLLKEAADIATKGHLNEVRGREILSEMIKISTGKGMLTYTAREWFDSWLADKEKANAQGTFVRYRGVIGQFLNFLGTERADGNLMNLTPEDVRSFRDAELVTGKTPSTVNDAVKTIRTSLNKAKKQQLILLNPADAVEMLVETEVEKAIFSPADVLRLLSVAEDDWKGVILFGYYTGASLGDITNARWNQIDLVKGTFSYKRRKTKKPVVVPIWDDELKELLLSRPSSDNPRDYIFSTLAEKSTAGKSGLSMKFTRLMKKAELSGEAISPIATNSGKKSEGRTRNTLTFHSLRHTFNSIMADKGVLQDIRKRLTGQSSSNTNDRYTHMELESLFSAIRTIPSIRQLAFEQENGQNSGNA